MAYLWYVLATLRISFPSFLHYVTMGILKNRALRKRFVFMVLRKIVKKLFSKELKHDKKHWVDEFNTWKNKKDRESSSGIGSSMQITKVLREELIRFISENDIQSMADIPCGDFNWMQHVVSAKLDYTGFDIVDNMIARNQELFESKNIHFYSLDLFNQSLEGNYDVIFSRDFFVHFMPEEIIKLLKHMSSANVKYFMSTTYPETQENNCLKRAWFPYNLQLAPFNFPEPILTIDEKLTEKEGGYYRKKCVGVWDFDFVKKDKKAR